MKTLALLLVLTASAGVCAAEDDGGLGAAAAAIADARSKAVAQAKDESALRAAERAAAPRRGYFVPPANSPGAEQFRHLVAMIANRRSDVGGGPEHLAALVGEPCVTIPAGCVSLIEPLHDWIQDDGDATSPYVYSMLDKVLAIVGDRLGSLNAVAAQERTFVLLAGSPKYQGRGAAYATVESLRGLLASTRRIEFDMNDLHIYPDAKDRNIQLSQMGAELTGLYSDAPAAHLGEPLQALIYSKDPGTAVAALKSATRLQPTQATLDAISALIADPKTRLPRTDVPAAVQTTALEQSGKIAWTLWHQSWAEAARPTRDAIRVLGEDAKEEGAPRKAVFDAAYAAYRMYPKPPEETRKGL